MRPTRVLFLLLVLTLLSVRPASAQAGASNGQPATGGAKTPPVTLPSAATQWVSLQNLGKPKAVTPAVANDPASVKQAVAQTTAAYLSDADQLHAFYTKSPSYPAANEAKRLEATSLIYAQQLGDTSQDTRRKQLVAQVRQDTTLPIPARAQTAALADHVDVARRTDLTVPEKVSAYEQVVRSLIKEFPSMPDGYAALVQVAKDSPDAQAKAIAQDVLAMSMPAAAVKVEAQTVLNRLALIGQSLPDIAAPILGKDNPLDRAKNHPVILYSWATFSDGSIAAAKNLAAKAPPTAVLIGVCLDFKDLAPAKQRAKDEKLVGEQIYDWMGSQGELATRLLLNNPGVIYVTDDARIIRNVSAQRDLSAALATFGK